MGRRQIILAALILLLVLGVALSGCLKRKEQPGAAQDPQQTVDANIDNDANSSNSSDQNTQVVEAEKTFMQLQNDCLENTVPARADACLLDLAKSRKDTTPCAKLAQFSEERCIFETAKSIDDESFCIKISEAQYANDCYEYFGKTKASADMCAKVSDQARRDECYSVAGSTSGKGFICALIFDPPIRDSCYIESAKVSMDYSLCKNVSLFKDSLGYARDRCYKEATSDLNGPLCFNLLDGWEMSNCFYTAIDSPPNDVDCSVVKDLNANANCNFWVASKSGNFTPCLGLEKELSDLCIERVIAINRDPTQCTVPEEFEQRNSCYWHVARYTNDSIMCKSISGDTTMKDNCLYDVAVATQDLATCLQIRVNNIPKRDECFARVAAITGETALCERVNGDTLYFNCYADVASKYSAPEICDESPRKRLKLLPYSGSNYCYNELAYRLRDEKYCAQISVPGFREDCEQRIEDVLKCVNGDDVCDDDICNYTVDSDCKSPFYCETDLECNDLIGATTDFCYQNSCRNTYGTGCISGDGVCYPNCVYKGSADVTIDPNTGIKNEDSDCLAPCSFHGGILCSADTNCTIGFRISAVESNCCQVQTACVTPESPIS